MSAGLCQLTPCPGRVCWLHPTGAGGHHGAAPGQDLAPGNCAQSQARGIGPPSHSKVCDMLSADPRLHRCSPCACAAGQTCSPSLCKLTSDI